jgi:hypothetical protein
MLYFPSKIQKAATNSVSHSLDQIANAKCKGLFTLGQIMLYSMACQFLLFFTNKLDLFPAAPQEESPRHLISKTWYVSC